MTSESGRDGFQKRMRNMLSTLRMEIINEIRQEGTFLPSESTLAKQFNLSNNSVRKGLEQLVSEGLIKKIDRVGSVVLKADRSTVTVRLGITPTLTTDFLVKDLITDFETLHPGIRIAVFTIDPSNFVGVTKEMSQNGILDVVAINGTHLQEMAEQDELSLLKPIDMDPELYPITNQAFQIEGQTFARPISFSPIILCYNKQHFQEANLLEPNSYWTWNDLVHVSEKLAMHRGRYAFTFESLSLNRFPLFLLQGGMISENKAFTRDEVELRLRESLHLFSHKLVNNHRISPKFAANDIHEVNQLFREEQVSMILTTYFNLNSFKKFPFEYDISPLPRIRKDDPQKSLTVTIGMAIMQSSKEKEAAYKLVDFLSSKRAQQFIRNQTLSIPARISEAEAPTSNQMPSRYGLYRELIPTFHHHHELGIPISQLKSFTTVLKAYWSDMIDESELLAALDNSSTLI